MILKFEPIEESFNRVLIKFARLERDSQLLRFRSGTVPLQNHRLEKPHEPDHRAVPDRSTEEVRQVRKMQCFGF